MTTLATRNVLQAKVREAKSITGFSYPFLRLLVDEAELLYQQDALYADNERSELKPECYALMEHINRQMSEAYPCRTHMEKEEVRKALDAAQNFLKVFEPM